MKGRVIPLPTAPALASPTGRCLTCPRETTLIAEWRGEGEGVCWICWTQFWDVAPMIPEPDAGRTR